MDNLIKIGNYALIIWLLLKSPFMGLIFIAYTIYYNKKLQDEKKKTEKVQKMLELVTKSHLEEEKAQEILTKNLENVEIKENVTNFEPYNSCVIENYHNKFWRIMKPSGEYLPKIFLSLEEAKKEIDFVAPFLIKPDRTSQKRRVYNIRYVK